MMGNNRLQTIDFITMPFRSSIMAKADLSYSGYFHYHQGVELLYIHEGSGTLVLDQQVHTMKPGDLYIFQPFQLHHVKADVGEETPYVRSRIQFEPQVFQRYFEPFEQLMEVYQHLWKGAMQKQVFRLMPQHAPIETLLQYYGTASMLPGHERGRMERFATLLQQLLLAVQGQLQDVLPQPGFAATRSLTHSEAVLQWVEQHYAEPYRLEVLAEELHISKYHLLHTFKRETGSTITDYIQVRRMKEACQLLGSSSLPVADIGTQVGWPVASHFVQRFKKWTGVTPHQYRKRQRRAMAELEVKPDQA
ncbi:helix-turn-helix domain-containing protein [Paenibacillus sp. F411]|nr:MULTISPECIES: AraC family transcriptional regulator [Paenibacillus]MBO2945596.1 helix-turn-helix domain-containing protein [Paenibacillus sp. F411]